MKMKIFLQSCLIISLLNNTTNTFANDNAVSSIEIKNKKELLKINQNQVYLNSTTFPDEELRKKLIATFNVSEGDDITDKCLDTTELIIDTNITNLQGMEYFTNLEKLQLIGDVGKPKTLLPDLTPLSKLNLSSLLINNYEINSLVQLQSMNTLTSLVLISVNILNSNVFDDLSNLYNLTSLEIKSSDLQGKLGSIKSLHNLTELSISNSNVSDITGISELKNLVTADLGNNNISDFTELLDLPNLDSIGLEDNNIQSLRPFIKAQKDYRTINLKDNNFPPEDYKYLPKQVNPYVLIINHGEDITKYNLNLEFYRYYDWFNQSFTDKITNWNDMTISNGIFVKSLNRNLALENIVIKDKEYDNQTNAEIVSYDIVGLEDWVTLDEGIDYTISANFENCDVGDNKKVFVETKLIPSRKTQFYTVPNAIAKGNILKSNNSNSSSNNGNGSNNGNSSGNNGSTTNNGNSSSNNGNSTNNGNSSSNNGSNTDDNINIDNNIQDNNYNDLDYISNGNGANIGNTKNNDIGSIKNNNNSNDIENITFEDIPDEYITRADFSILLNKTIKYLGFNNNKIDIINTYYKDLKTDKYYYDDVLEMTYLNILIGYNNGLFKPETFITREESVVALSKLMNLCKVNIPSIYSKEFKDYDQISNWAKPYFDDLNNKGMISGYVNHNEFKPKATITRAEAMVMIFNLLTKL